MSTNQQTDTVTYAPFGSQNTQHLPHSSEAEQALLGLLMLNNDKFDDISGMLTPEHFYVTFHAEIFENMAQLLAKGFEANPISIYENLKSNHEDEENLKETLVTIMENASLTDNVRDLTNFVHNFYQQRQLISISTSLSSDATQIKVSEQDSEIQRIISQTESDLYTLGEAGSGGSAAVVLRDPIKNVLVHVEEVKKNQNKLIGATSGMQTVDDKIGGFQRSDLVILAARPSMGKTAFAVNVAVNAATAAMNNKPGGVPVALFSMEMSAEQLASRILSSEAKINSFKLQDGSLNNDEFDRLVAVSNTLNGMQLFIDDTPQLSISALRSRARRLRRQHNVGMIVVDYLQLMRGSSRRGENRVQEISEISQGLKAMARELDVPVIALSQLSRGVEARENKRPMLSDLRESGSIEQDADMVMFLYREDYYFEKAMGADPTEQAKEKLEQIKGVSELLISKNRKGPTCSVKLTFVPEHTTFKDYISQEVVNQYTQPNGGNTPPAF